MKTINKKITNFIFPNLILLAIALGSILGSKILNYLLNTTCAYKNVFGIICPFCGTTRATINILKLNFKEAFMFHPSTVLLFFLILFLDIYYLLNYKKDLNKKMYNIFFILCSYITITIVQYFLRLYFIFRNLECGFMYLSL